MTKEEKVREIIEILIELDLVRFTDDSAVSDYADREDI